MMRLFDQCITRYDDDFVKELLAGGLYHQMSQIFDRGPCCYFACPSRHYEARHMTQECWMQRTGPWNLVSYQWWG